MKLAVVSHKPCWRSAASPSGYATDGGFPMHMRALSELFEATVVVVPCTESKKHAGETPLEGQNLSITPLGFLRGAGLRQKACFLLWLLRNGLTLLREVRRADAIHAPIPGNVGTIGMLLAVLFRKPLFVRHCGNWFVQRTLAEHFWKWFMERFAGGRNVMLATGGAAAPPSARNPEVRWIFSTSLTEQELEDCRAPRQSVSNDHPRLIIACRQEECKGTDRVIESLPLLLDEFPKLTLDVVGDGSLLPKLRQLAMSRGVSDHVLFHGKLVHARVLDLLKRADLFCYPTTASEGFPKVVLEALACGLPVVTTKVSVLPQLIGDQCGVLIDEVTPEAIAQAVTSCLVDEDRYRHFSHTAVETARQYSMERWRETLGARLRAAWGPLHNNDRLG